MTPETPRKKNKFAAAARGIWIVILSRDMLPHVIMACLATSAGFVFRISPDEWCLQFICIGCVIGAEAVNSAIETLCNRITPEYDEYVRNVKDIAAGAVLILSIAAAIAGLIIYIPKIIALFGPPERA